MDSYLLKISLYEISSFSLSLFRSLFLSRSREMIKKIVNLYPTIVGKAFISEIPPHLSLESIKNHRSRSYKPYPSSFQFHLSARIPNFPSIASIEHIVPSFSFYLRHSLLSLSFSLSFSSLPIKSIFN